jgi:hypothetical protein
MEIAGLYCSRLPVSERDNISPETLFDEGYATWRGVYPGDHIDSIKEKLEITKLAKTDPPRYFREIKAWAVNRMARLRDEGWRKAHDRE